MVHWYNHGNMHNSHLFHSKQDNVDLGNLVPKMKALAKQKKYEKDS